MSERPTNPSTRRRALGALAPLALLLAAGCDSAPAAPVTHDPPADTGADTGAVVDAAADATPPADAAPIADATTASDATAPGDAGCPQTPTTPDGMGRPRDAAGYVRYCWPGESHCFCDGDNDCYAMDGYVPCVFATRPDGGATDLGSLPGDGGVCPSGTRLCPTTPFTNEPTSSFRCRAPLNGACPGPDLIVGRDWTLDPDRNGRLYLTTETFAPGAAEITEGCVTQAGTRRLLRFNFAAFNVGNENLNVGRPDERDTVHWEFFAAHGHWHVKGWGDLQLRRLDGTVLGRGRKLSFCLEDNIRIDDMAGPRQFAPPLCENFDPRTSYAERPDFGLSVSWGDIYPHDVRCQFIDLGAPTPGAGYLADGFYNLVLSINLGDRTPMPLYRELDYTNNSVSYRVEIRGAEATVCNDRAGEACPTGTLRCDGTCAP